MTLLQRPRRNRKNETIRSYHRETWLSPQHLMYPLFIHDKTEDEAISSMPGCSRLSPDGLYREVEASLAVDINTFVLFPAEPDSSKTPLGEESFNPDGLVQRTLRNLKQRWPDITLVTDVALDPYSSDGHDGIVAEDGTILNDDTVDVLCQQALSQAEAGADIIAPSDMMDGRIGAIRETLDHEDFTNVSLLSYTAKYASAFYGPFRDALDSAPKHGDKKTYQMDPANAREAIRELYLDEEEGADMVMVKPAGPYLDVIALLRSQTALPLAAYQVSGEYAMLKAACQNGWLTEEKVVPESLMAIRRAGADIILTYFARQVATWIKDDVIRCS